MPAHRRSRQYDEIADAFSRTRFNRTVHAVSHLAEQLKAAVADLAEQDGASVTAELTALGFDPAALGAGDVQELLDHTDYLPEDAAGFLWAIGAFLSTVDTTIVPIEEGSATPCALVGG